MKSPPFRFATLTLGLGLFFLPTLRADPGAEASWQEVLRLDAGPPPPPPRSGHAQERLPAKALRERYSRHLILQEKALRAYLALPGSEPHAFEGRFRLARVLSLRADIEENPTLQNQSSALLDGLDAIASPEQKAHIAFTRISQKMRSNRLPSREERAQLLTEVRAFLKKFPNDPRGARLLVEVATQCDREPELKRALLTEASMLTQEPPLQERIADDLKKLSLLGKPLPLNFPTPDGAPFNASRFEGTPVVILFFTEESIPSLIALDALNEALRAYPKIAKVAFSLDREQTAMERIRSTSAIDWKMCWDGSGWEGAVARGYGINAAPTAWLLDFKGRLQSLNVLEEMAKQLAEAAAQAGLAP